MTDFNRKELAEAEEAWRRGNDPRAIAILERLIQCANRDAQLLLATIFTCMDPREGKFSEGIDLLRQLADTGDGHAAHNLGTALRTAPKDFKRGAMTPEHYYQIAVDSGFEASVSGNPYWWKASRE